MYLTPDIIGFVYKHVWYVGFNIKYNLYIVNVNEGLLAPGL